MIPLGLYVHLPWCKSKCPYCDFNSYATSGRIPAEQYVEQLLADLESESLLADGRKLGSLFFGGGTPSLFAPRHIGQIIEAADRLVGFGADSEITMEANPGALESGPLGDYRGAGVNRLSLGAQSFDDESLARIGRLHDAQTAVRAIEQAQTAGFDNFNVDLMYGLPEQTPEMAISDIRAAIALAPSHISHYQLTLEPNTRFHESPPELPSEDTCWSMQIECQDELAKGGYQHYEVSAYARPGRRSAHNMNYWTYGDYLAVGAGAHGKVTDQHGVVRRRVKVKHPRLYLTTPAPSLQTETRPDNDERAFEFVLNAMRLVDGFSWGQFENRTGLSRQYVKATVDALIADTLLISDDETCRPTKLGRRFLDEVTLRFLPAKTHG